MARISTTLRAVAPCALLLCFVALAFADSGRGSQSRTPARVAADSDSVAVTLTLNTHSLTLRSGETDTLSFTITRDTVPITPPDTVPPDTVPLDTVPPDTVPIDTVPLDTVPPDTVPVTPPDTVPIDTVPIDTVPIDTVPVTPPDTVPTVATDSVVWRTTDAEVVQLRVVGDSVVLTALKPGEALVIASLAGNDLVADTCRVTVTRPRGDANADGSTDVDDLNAMLNVMLELSPLPGEADMPYYDLNADGHIDVEDMNKLINIMLEIDDDDDQNTFTVNGVTFTMVPIAGSTFALGATPDEQRVGCKSDELPQCTVTLDDYRLGATEVTQELWEAVMGYNPSFFTTDPQLPVERVSWLECQAFVERLGALTGKPFRLPTEAEWEWAARGADKSRGTTYAGSNTIAEVAWCYGAGSTQTRPVATKAANELGLYDMSGNVWEWCADWYASDSYATSQPGGQAEGSARVMRGGGCCNEPAGCRVSNRGSATPTAVFLYTGLRLAL